MYAVYKNWIYNDHMADVEFETDNQFKIPMSTSIGVVQAENKMAEWLMHKKIAKTSSQAAAILLGVAGAAFVIAVIAFWVHSSGASTQHFVIPPQYEPH